MSTQDAAVQCALLDAPLIPWCNVREQEESIVKLQGQSQLLRMI